MEINPKEVGARIKSIRKSKGLTMDEFGKLVGIVSRGNISNWERGVHAPNNTRIKVIADFAGITVDELIYGIGKFQASNGMELSVEEVAVIETMREEDVNPYAHIENLNERIEVLEGIVKDIAYAHDNIKCLQSDINGYIRKM